VFSNCSFDCHSERSEESTATPTASPGFECLIGFFVLVLMMQNERMVGPALAAGPSRSAPDNRDGLPASGSPTNVRRRRHQRLAVAFLSQNDTTMQV
jgi:hypothetical protein